MTRAFARIPQAVAVVLACLLAGGCAMDSKLHSYRMERLSGEGLGKVVRELSAESLDPSGSPRDGSDTVDLLELGLALSENGDHQKSNEILESVYRRYVADDEGPVISLRKTGSSLAEATISAGLSEYDPAEFEKIFLHALKEKNYLLMGDLDGAAVEARRARLIERALREKVDGEKASVREDYSTRKVDGKLEIPAEIRQKLAKISSYTENPFAMALTAFTHAARGERDDALIELGRAAAAVDSAQLKRLDETLRCGAPLPNVFVFALCDRAPVKRSVDIRIFNFSSGAMQKLSFPQYVQRKGDVWSVEAGGGPLDEIAVMDLLAYKEYEDKLPYEIFKTFTRAAARTAKDLALSKDNKGLGGLVGTITNEFLEGADARSWTMLPKMVYFGALNSNDVEFAVEVKASGGNRVLKVAIDPAKLNLIFVTANAQGYSARAVSFQAGATGGTAEATCPR